MDRNTITGLLLIVLIFLTFSIFQSGEDPKEQDGKKGADTTQTANVPADTVVAEPTLTYGMSDSAFKALPDSTRDSIIDAENNMQYGEFASLYEGEEQTLTVNTDMFRVTLSSKGAMVRALNLQAEKYVTFDGKPLPLVKESLNNRFSFQFYYAKARSGTVDTKDLFFTPNVKDKEIKVSGADSATVVFTGQLAEGKSVSIRYKFYGDRWDYDYDISMQGMRQVFAGSRDKYRILWETEVPKTEKAMQLQREKTAIYYHVTNDDVYDLNARSLEPVTESINDADWISFKSQFFAHTMITKPTDAIKSADLEQKTPKTANAEDKSIDTLVRAMAVDVPATMPAEGEFKRGFTFYAGPLDYDHLATYERDLEYQVYLGWLFLKYINRYLILPAFHFLEGIFGSYGVIILILALLVKMLLYPLTRKMYISTAKMRIVNQSPEIKALEAKYKDEPTKLQQEKMAIYRRTGVSMFGGCLPMLLQYPFLISLFFLFPNLIELRQQGFLWAEDLSTYDSVLDLGFNIPMYGDHVSLFTLLMTISIFVYTYINQQAQGMTAQNSFMKYFPYFFPLLLLGFLNNYSAGLSWYYLIQNVISIGQTTITKAFIDDEKLLAQMEASKKKKGGSKKSRMQTWLENQQKKQQAQQAGRGKRR